MKLTGFFGASAHAEDVEQKERRSKASPRMTQRTQKQNERFMVLGNSSWGRMYCGGGGGQ